MASGCAPVTRPFLPLVLVMTGMWTGWSESDLVAAPADAADLAFFEKKIRPLLIEHCYSCHSGDAKMIEGGLRVDGRERLLRGGDSGAAIVPGNAEESLLVKAIRYQAVEMPPQGKLADASIESLVRWIERGAVWPQESSGSTTS